MANRKKTRGSKRRKRKDRCRSKRRKRGGGGRAIESGWLKEGGDSLLRNRLIDMANQNYINMGKE